MFSKAVWDVFITPSQKSYVYIYSYKIIYGVQMPLLGFDQLPLDLIPSIKLDYSYIPKIIELITSDSSQFTLHHGSPLLLIIAGL